MCLSFTLIQHKRGPGSTINDDGMAKNDDLYPKADFFHPSCVERDEKEKRLND